MIEAVLTELFIQTLFLYSGTTTHHPGRYITRQTKALHQSRLQAAQSSARIPGPVINLAPVEGPETECFRELVSRDMPTSVRSEESAT